MSIAMDSQDLRGYLRGMCLVLAVRTTARAPGRVDIDDVLGKHFARDIQAIVAALAGYTGMDAGSLTSAIDELFQSDAEYLRPDNLNLQLGLLSGRPVPVFPFVNEDGVCQVALLRPFLDTAKNLVHAAVRLRMQSPPAGPSEPFWPAVAQFLRRAGGDNDVAEAIAVATIANVVSDVLFFNSDAPSRANDPALAERIERVLAELRTTDVAAAASSTGKE